MSNRENLTLIDIRVAHSLLYSDEDFIYPSNSKQYSGDNEEYILSGTFEVIHFKVDVQPHKNRSG